jgi:branched-chain amino acid transport system ATP-binding protein
MPRCGGFIWDRQAMAQLQLDDLHVFLGDSYVVQGVSLAVAEGRSAVILGRNGVGKTTLLRAVMGLTEAPRHGAIRWDDSELTHAPAWRRSNAGLGYVPQGRRIFPSLTVEENLRVARRTPRPGLAPWTIERLYRLFPNLEARRQQRASVLSGGEQQMLAIGRALVGNPRIILLDEPTEGLAPAFVQRVLEVLQEVRRAGQAILLVEQNFRFAASLADEINVMQAGRFVFRGEKMSEGDLLDMAERYLGIAGSAAA